MLPMLHTNCFDNVRIRWFCGLWQHCYFTIKMNKAKCQNTLYNILYVNYDKDLHKCISYMPVLTNFVPELKIGTFN